MPRPASARTGPRSEADRPVLAVEADRPVLAVEADRPVLGVDAYPKGWVGVRLDGHGRFAGAGVHTEIDALVAQLGGEHELAVVAVDIPIGLPDRGERAAEGLARKLVGPRTSSVFSCPTRTAVEAPDFASALAAQRSNADGKGLSRQSYALRSKILQVDRWLREADPSCRVVEVHPEVIFAELAGQPLSLSKKTWTGAARRRTLLLEAGIELAGELGPAGAAGTDGVLDAAAAAWTARRVLLGQARRLPAVPQVFSDGIETGIWY